MDIIKSKKKNHPKRSLAIGSAAIVLTSLLFVFFLQPKGQHKIDRDQLLLGTVQRGDLEVAIDGYGILRSDKQTLITALTAATVEEVLLRPGAPVREGSIIMQLSNPELAQELEAAGIALAQEEANLRRLKLSNQRELLAEQSSLAELSANLKVIQLRREAEQKLVANGVVSQLTYKTTLLQQEQMQQRVKLQQQRINQLEEVVRESQIIQKEQINQAKAHYESIQQRTDRLTVRAGIDGILQRLPVELGQSVTAGQELALVGSDKDLLALIQIPQSRAERIKVGQKAQINTRREKVAGMVTRIAPEVTDGNIEVEIAFSEGVPASARPELNVDAKIFTATLQNTLYIERPLNAQSHSNISLFRVQPDGSQAELQQVILGEESGRFIQVVSGAIEEDRFILSDMTNFNDSDQIRIIN